MASDLIGRASCPECGFASAHIKIKTDKEGAHPYRHCPDCGAQYFTRTKLQASNLMLQIRPGSQTTQTPTQTQTPDTPPEAEGVMADAAVGHAKPPPAQQLKTVFGVRVPV
jgi:predicted  nucleic acid-binding Zn-ribbon protein